MLNFASHKLEDPSSIDKKQYNNPNVFKSSIRNGGKNESKSLSKGKKNYKTLFSDLEKTYDINMDI